MQEAKLRAISMSTPPLPHRSLSPLDRQPIEELVHTVFPVRTCKQHHSSLNLSISQLTCFHFLCRGMFSGGAGDDGRVSAPLTHPLYPPPSLPPSSVPLMFKGLTLEYCFGFVCLLLFTSLKEALPFSMLETPGHASISFTPTYSYCSVCIQGPRQFLAVNEQDQRLLNLHFK